MSLSAFWWLAGVGSVGPALAGRSGLAPLYADMRSGGGGYAAERQECFGGVDFLVGEAAEAVDEAIILAFAA